jgi:hypothetical protein
MNMNRYLPLLSISAVFTLCACATSDDDTRPIPGTLQSTDSKNSENNTPRTNPTPNPEPASNPPGPESDMHPVAQ